jgi:hypothetical protein
MPTLFSALSKSGGIRWFKSYGIKGASIKLSFYRPVMGLIVDGFSMLTQSVLMREIRHYSGG